MVAVCSAKVCDHREHAPVGVVALGQVELHQHAADVPFDSALGDYKMAGDRLVVSPYTISASTSRSRALSASSASVSLPTRRATTRG